MNEDKEGTAAALNQTPINELQQNVKPKIRIDRLGNEIIPRRFRLKNNLKSTHKVTYIDQIHL